MDAVGQESGGIHVARVLEQGKDEVEGEDVGDADRQGRENAAVETPEQRARQGALAEERVHRGREQR